MRIDENLVADVHAEHNLVVGVEHDFTALGKLLTKIGDPLARMLDLRLGVKVWVEARRCLEIDLSRVRRLPHHVQRVKGANIAGSFELISANICPLFLTEVG